MDYICICMSPALDANVALTRAPKGAGEVFKDAKIVENAGGKAVNVARWLAIRGCRVACLGLLGADNDGLFVRAFAEYGIADRMTRVPGTTRRNEMIVWPDGSFKVNQAAFPDVAFDETAFLARLDAAERLGAGSVVVISGSLPKCCRADFYAKAVAAVKAKGAFVVLDSSGEPMRLALEAHPDLVKPNAEECEALVGFVPESSDDFARATALLRKKAAHVIISDGEKGAWFDGEFVPAPSVRCVDSTAAGDTLLAEYCYQRFSADRTDLRFAVAAGSAAVEMPGSNPPSPARVAALCAAVG